MKRIISLLSLCLFVSAYCSAQFLGVGQEAVDCYYALPQYENIILNKSPRIELTEINYAKIDNSKYQLNDIHEIEIRFTIDDTTTAGKKLNKDLGEVCGAPLTTIFKLKSNYSASDVSVFPSHLSRDKSDSNKYLYELSLDVVAGDNWDYSKLLDNQIKSIQFIEQRYDCEIVANMTFDRPVDEIGNTLRLIGAAMLMGSQQNEKYFPNVVKYLKKNLEKYTGTRKMRTISEIKTAGVKLPAANVKSLKGYTALPLMNLINYAYGIWPLNSTKPQLVKAMRANGIKVADDWKDRRSLMIFNSDNYKRSCMGLDIYCVCATFNDDKLTTQEYQFSDITADDYENQARDFVEKVALALDNQGACMTPYDKDWDSSVFNEHLRGGYRGFIGNKQIIISYSCYPECSKAIVKLDVIY